MWEPRQKQRTYKEHGIAWATFTTYPIFKLEITVGIPTYNIILSFVWQWLPQHYGMYKIWHIL
jgi:hypothetical protein